MKPKIDTFINRIACQNTKIVLVAKMAIVYITLVHSKHLRKTYSFIEFKLFYWSYVPILKVPGIKCRKVSFRYENVY